MCVCVNEYVSAGVNRGKGSGPQQKPSTKATPLHHMQQSYLKTCRGQQHLAGSGGNGGQGGRGRRPGGGRRGRGQPGTGRRASLWRRAKSSTDWTPGMVSQRPPYLEMVSLTLGLIPWGNFGCAYFSKATACTTTVYAMFLCLLGYGYSSSEAVQPNPTSPSDMSGFYLGKLHEQCHQTLQAEAVCLGKAKAATTAALSSPSSVSNVLVFTWIRLQQPKSGAVQPYQFKGCLSVFCKNTQREISIHFAKAGMETPPTLVLFPTVKGCHVHVAITQVNPT